MTAHVARLRPWAVVPVKAFAQAKRRLAPVMAPDERAALARAMLHDVLAALAGSDDLAGILVITSDPAAAELVRDYGAVVRPDGLDQGTNAAVCQGLRVLQRHRQKGAMIVPGDVPFITRAEIGEVVDAMTARPLVLVPATRDGGTNLLAGALPLPIAPAFGTGSFSRHLAAARSCGIDPAVIRLQGLGRDIDVAGDLASPAEGAPRSRALINRFAPLAPTPSRGWSLPNEEPLTT